MIFKLFKYKVLFICLVTSTSCTEDLSDLCYERFDQAKTFEDSINTPLFVPSASHLKLRLEKNLMDAEFLTALQTREVEKSCLDSFLIWNNSQLKSIKSWTFSLENFTLDKQLKELDSGESQKEILAFIPEFFTSWKRTLQLQKLELEQDDIKRFEQFFKQLDSLKKNGLPNELIIESKIATKDFLAFLWSHKSIKD
jgi:hypothetical protein